MYVQKASKRRESSDAADHAVGREVKSRNVGNRTKCEGSGFVEDVGSHGNLPE